MTYGLSSTEREKTAKKIQHLELLLEIIRDIICDLAHPTMKEAVPNQTQTVGMVVIGQFRRREHPDQVETFNLQHGELVYLGTDGQTEPSPAKGTDFPDVLDFNIHPGL